MMSLYLPCSLVSSLISASVLWYVLPGRLISSVSDISPAVDARIWYTQFSIYQQYRSWLLWCFNDDVSVTSEEEGAQPCNLAGVREDTRVVGQYEELAEFPESSGNSEAHPGVLRYGTGKFNYMWLIFPYLYLVQFPQNMPVSCKSCKFNPGRVRGIGVLYAADDPVVVSTRCQYGRQSVWWYLVQPSSCSV